MRKLVTAVLSTAMLGMFAASSFAAFTSVSKSTATASVSFTAEGVVNVAIEIRNRSNSALASALTWTGVTPGTTAWAGSDQYILMLSNITAATGGVQIYTDNKSAEMAHPYTGVSTATVAGLVGWNAANPSLSSSTLPMCWRVTDAATADINIVRGAPGFPDRLWEQTLGNAFPCYLWMLDKATGGALEMGMDYITVKDKARGIQFAEATFGTTLSPDYIYVGADFSNAVTPADYATVLRLEAFTE